MSNLTFDQLVQLGNEVKFSFNAAIATEGDYTNTAYRKRVFKTLGAWMYEVNCSVESGVISTDEAINGLFKPMQLANKNTITMYRESGVNPVQLKVKVVDQSAEIAELNAKVAMLTKDVTRESKRAEVAERELIIVTNRLSQFMSKVRTVNINGVLTKMVEIVKQ